MRVMMEAKNETIHRAGRLDVDPLNTLHTKEPPSALSLPLLLKRAHLFICDRNCFLDVKATPSGPSILLLLPPSDR